MGSLRSGFSTGACAAAASKAATLALLGQEIPTKVSIPFPDGSRHHFPLHSCTNHGTRATASVIKDAGDDPDVTNGAEICAQVVQGPAEQQQPLIITAGTGVGTVTKPGLPVPVDQPAINPGPQGMIQAAIAEALHELGLQLPIQVEISVPNGEELAEKTLNRRLGIMGGLSILGTTGIVRPVSAKAWTDTIEASMDVARAAGVEEVILSTGRTSEAAVQALLALPEEAQVMMGDYLHYALTSAHRHKFTTIHLAGMWAKVLKCALTIPQTHVRNGALDVRQAADLLAELGLERLQADALATANTAREILLRLREQGRQDLVRKVCERAQEYAQQTSSLPVRVYLVTSEDGVIEQL